MRRMTTETGTPHVTSVSKKSQNDDVPSADREVTWIVIDDVSVPCIMRGKKRHGPVRVLEQKLLNRLSTTAAVNAAFRDHPLLVSNYLTDREAYRLTRAASHQYHPFTAKDLVVDMEEFCELYSHLKSTLLNETVTGGWVQVNNSVIPYISANVYKLLPLSVVRNAAGLLCDAPVTLKMRVPTSAQCRYLNELCASTGLDFKFDATTSLVSLADVYALSDPTPYTHQLPMDDPFSHAKYIDEALHPAASTSALAPVCAQSWYTTTNTVTTPGVLAAGSAGPVGSRPANVMSSLQPSQMTQQVVGPDVGNTRQSSSSQSSAVIEPVYFRGRTISSLRRPADDNRYVLLDAVCRVFFPHQQNVSGFMRAAETLFHIPDVRMSDETERQFIGFYKLPTDRLRCNKLISLDLLADIFPRLEAMFAIGAGTVNGQVIGALIPRPPIDRATTTHQQTVQTTTTTTNNDNNNEDVTRPRKRRRNNACNDVIVID